MCVLVILRLFPIDLIFHQACSEGAVDAATGYLDYLVHTFLLGLSTRTSPIPSDLLAHSRKCSIVQHPHPNYITPGVYIQFK